MPHILTPMIMNSTVATSTSCQQCHQFCFKTLFMPFFILCTIFIYYYIIYQALFMSLFHINLSRYSSVTIMLLIQMNVNTRRTRATRVVYGAHVSFMVHTCRLWCRSVLLMRAKCVVLLG